MLNRELTGCEIANCPMFYDRMCHDSRDYVDEETGQDMCPLNSASVPREEYLERRAANGN